MPYKAKIYNNIYTLEDGFIIKEELNENLDSGTIKFNLVGTEADIECFDKVKIFYEENETEQTVANQLINQILDEETSFIPTLDHQYTLNLISNTKLLERKTCPNVTITQGVKTGHRETYNGTIETNCKGSDGYKVVNIKDFGVNPLARNTVFSNVSIEPIELIPIGASASIVSFNANTGEIIFTIGATVLNEVVYGTLTYKKSRAIIYESINVFGKQADGVKNITITLEEGQQLRDVSIELDEEFVDVQGAFCTIVSFDEETGEIQYRCGQSIANRNVSCSISYSKTSYNQIFNESVSGKRIEGQKIFQVPLIGGEYISDVSIRIEGEYEDPYCDIISTSSNGEIVFEGGETDDEETQIVVKITYDVEYTIGNEYYGVKVYDELLRILDLFSPKIRLGNENSFIWVNKFTMSNRVYEKFKDTICPELQWNDPTLREILNDLFSTEMCIPIVDENNVIDFIDLRSFSYGTTATKPIDLSHIERGNKLMNGEDYCDNLTLNIKNSINKKVVKAVEYTSFRSNGEGELKTDNIILKTQKPIYRITKLTISCYFWDIRTAIFPYNDRYVEFDITDFVYEKDAWNTLPQLGVTLYNRYGKDSTLYFSRGDNIIYNANVSIVKLVKELIFERLKITWDDAFFRFDDVRYWFACIEYETIDNSSINIGKTLPLKHKENSGNYLFDSQTNSYVDGNHQADYEYSKVNRLGNKIHYIYGTYYNENDVPNLGDFIGDEILFSRTKQYYDGLIKFEGQLIPNYVLKNYYTGIQSKIRSWNIASGKEALLRVDIIKYYLEFSFRRKTDNIELNINNNDIFLSAFFTNDLSDNLQYIIYKGTTKENIVIPDSTHGYLIETKPEKLGNSISVNYFFEENYVASEHIKTDNSFQVETYKYTDDNGEIEKTHLYLANYVSPTDGEFEVPEHGNKYNHSQKEAMLNKALSKPICYIPNTRYIFDLEHITKKDQREILGGTIEFEYCTETEDIIFGNALLENNNLICIEQREGTYGEILSSLVLYSSTDKININNPDNLPSNKELESITDIHIYLGEINVIFNKSSATKLSYYLCYNDKVLIAWNENGDVGQINRSIFLNILKERDDNIYNNEGIVVGDICE